MTGEMIPSRMVVPLISVVIPTFQRPQCVLKAVQSALGQTLKELEVIVVMDGYDQETADTLSTVEDSRLRLMHLPEKAGGNPARNLGCKAAKAEWIAVLDDDDIWLPEKLERQWAFANERARPGIFTVVACQAVQRMPGASILIPRRPPSPDEPFSEYTVIRKGLTYGDGHVQTSTILAPAKLFREVLWDGTRTIFQEMDWLLKVLSRKDTQLAILMEPLSIWEAGEQVDRLSIMHSKWENTFQWTSNMRSYFTPRAYGALLCTIIADQASRCRGWAASRQVFQEIRQYGKPSIKEWFLFAYISLLPGKVRRRLREQIAVILNQTPTSGI